jgi:hypothetical protein
MNDDGLLRAMFVERRTPADETLDGRPGIAAATAGSLVGADGVIVHLVLGEMSFPFDVSDDYAAAIETHEATQGEGPGLDAARGDVTIAASRPWLERRYPVFAETMFRLSPFRSSLAMPLDLEGGWGGSVEFLFRNPRIDPHVDLVHAAAARSYIAVGIDSIRARPAEVIAALPRRQAVSMVQTHDQLSEAIASSYLRGYAVGHDLTLDGVCEALLDGELSAGDVTG